MGGRREPGDFFKRIIFRLLSPIDVAFGILSAKASESGLCPLKFYFFSFLMKFAALVGFRESCVLPVLFERKLVEISLPSV